MKKILTLFTALLFFGSMTVVKADTYVVAGNNADLFGDTWNGTKAANTMSWNGARSLYIKTYTATEAIEGVELKVVKNGSEWKGDFLGNNVMLMKLFSWLSCIMGCSMFLFLSVLPPFRADTPGKAATRAPPARPA